MTNEQSSFSQVRPVLIGFICLCCIGIFLGGLWDFSIDQYAFDPSSLWAQWLACAGPSPLYWNLIAAGSLMISHAKMISSRHFTCVRVIGFIMILGITSYAFVAQSSLIEHVFQMSTVLNCAINAILCVVVYLLPAICFAQALSLRWEKQISRVICFLILVAAVPMLLVNIVKMIWCRPRYVMLTIFPDVSFQPWYQLSTKLQVQTMSLLPVSSDLFKSFPSAHTSSAACILSFMLLYRPDHSHSIQRWLLILLILLFVGMVALSRIVLGMHFLSDVSAGFLCSTICVLFFFWLLFQSPKQ